MFNKKLATVLTSIHVWMIALSAIVWSVYAIWDASGYVDFSYAMGVFVGSMLAGFFTLSIWYLAVYLIRKAI